MHEMGVVIQIVKTADSFAKENGIEKIRSLTVQIGAASAVLPRYVEMFFPEVIKDYPVLHDSEIRMEAVPVKAFCMDCGSTFHPGDGCDCEQCRESRGEEKSGHAQHEHVPPRCPACGSECFKIIEGNTIMIKEMEIV